jgi:hypothetical protein
VRTVSAEGDLKPIQGGAEVTNIVRDRVAEHAVRRLGLGDVLRLLAEDDGELDLPVELVILGDGRDRDDRAWVADRGPRLEERDGRRWDREAALAGVVAVVEADAADGTGLGGADGT